MVTNEIVLAQHKHEDQKLEKVVVVEEKFNHLSKGLVEAEQELMGSYWEEREWNVMKVSTSSPITKCKKKNSNMRGSNIPLVPLPHD